MTDAPFRVDLAGPGDLNVIRSQWMADIFGSHDGSGKKELVGWPDARRRGRAYWLETEPEARDMLLSGLGAYVARDALGPPDNVVGWLVGDLARRTVHWVQVKHRWRGEGAGRTLLALVPKPAEGAPRTFTRYATHAQKERLERDGWIYRPHLAYTLQGETR